MVQWKLQLSCGREARSFGQHSRLAAVRTPAGAAFRFDVRDLTSFLAGGFDPSHLWPLPPSSAETVLASLLRTAPRVRNSKRFPCQAAWRTGLGTPAQPPQFPEGRAQHAGFAGLVHSTFGGARCHACPGFPRRSAGYDSDKVDSAQGHFLRLMQVCKFWRASRRRLPNQQRLPGQPRPSHNRHSKDTSQSIQNVRLHAALLASCQVVQAGGEGMSRVRACLSKSVSPTSFSKCASSWLSSSSVSRERRQRRALCRAKKEALPQKSAPASCRPHAAHRPAPLSHDAYRIPNRTILEPNRGEPNHTLETEPNQNAHKILCACVRLKEKQTKETNER